MQKKFIGVMIGAFALAACGETATTVADDTATVTAIPDTGVEMALIDMLDGNINNYCIDIAGGNENVDPANGLQAHTCYSYRGSLGTDQVFDETKIGENQLYMPVYDVCASAASMEAGAEIGLAACDGSEAQQFAMSETCTISPVAAENLCFTAGEDTRTGRSSDHQIKVLTLEECSEEAASRQLWAGRKSQEG